MNTRGRHITISLSTAKDIVRYMHKASEALEKDGSITCLNISRLLRKAARQISNSIESTIKVNSNDYE